MQNHLPKLAWHTRRTIEQLGLPGVAGLGMLAFCAMFYFSAVIPAGKGIRSLELEAAATQTHARHTAAEARLQPSRQLEAFYESFPKN